MELTGKCKEQFKKWYSSQEYNLSATHNAGYHPDNYIDWFYKLPKSMQYGVYVDFFDSVKYEEKSFFSKIFEIYYKDKTEYFTHNDIIRNSIEKANEIYNKIK
jgi:hypothetical protein